MGVEKILIVRLAGIGDVVMASSVIGQIRTEHLDATIHWLCGTTAAPLVEQFAGVDRVIAVDEVRLLRGGPLSRAREITSVWARLVGQHYSRVLLLHVDPRYRVLVAPITLPAVGARLSVLSRRDAHGAMNPVPGRSLSDEYARLATSGRAHIGPIIGRAPLATMRNPQEPASSAATARSDRGRITRIALVPAGTKNVLHEGALKRWPAERYADVARALTNDGYEVVLIGDGSDAWARPMFAGINVVDRMGQLTLPETVAELAECDLVISHDTGPMHLARLARVPVLALFGPTMPAQFAPTDDGTTVLWGGEHLACRPCYDGREFAACLHNECMTSLSTELVISAARTMLAQRGVATPDRSATQAPTETSAH